MKRIGIDLSLAALGHFLEKSIGLVVITILVRHIDKVSMGQFFYAISVCSIVAMLTELGTSRHLVRAVAGDTGHAAAHLQQVLRLRLPLLLIALVLVNLSVSLVAPSLSTIFLFCSIYVLAGDLYYTFSATLLGMRAVAARALTGLIGPCVLLLIVPFAAYRQWSLEQIVIAYALSSLLMTGISWRFTLRRVGRKVGGAVTSLRELLGSSLPLFILGLLMLAHARADEIMLANLRNFSEVAAYVAAYKLAEVSRTLIRPITMVFFPIMSATLVEHGPGRYRRDARRLIGGSAAIGLLVAFVVIPLAPFIVPWIFGAAYSEATVITQILFLVTPALFIGQMAVTVANALRLDRPAIGIVTMGLIANILLNAMIIPQWGAIGAAYTTVATESLIAVGLLFVIERGLRERISAHADADETRLSERWS
ncbi:MAG: oligosaccharide flippase family protein [Gammaproteobacteria bacterium]|nr:oligosaccharide flippase family protein [Gammaproteobacteria bacterium]